MAGEETDAADGLARLEAALDRIARQAPAAKPPVDTAALASRLDGLIDQVRDALAAEG